MVRTGVVYVTPPALVPPSLDSTSTYRTDVGSFHRTSRRIRLTMRLSDAGLRRRQTKPIYPDHRPPPWPTEDAAPRSLEPIVIRYHHPLVSPDRPDPSRSVVRQKDYPKDSPAAKSQRASQYLFARADEW